MRNILNCLFAVAFAASALPAQDNAAKRLAAVVAVATDEYGKAVDARGALVAPIELEEAQSFLTDAKEVAGRLSGPQTAEVRALLDTMLQAVTARRPPAQLDLLHARFRQALGADALLDLPTRRVDLARGRTLYDRNCASCHGLTGLGDGPAARGMTPAPPAIGRHEVMQDAAPGMMYRIVSVGISGTPMAGWASVLSPDERWDVVTYVNTLRGREQAVRGEALLRARCDGCAAGQGSGLGPAGLPPEISTTAWQLERSDAQLALAIAEAASAAKRPTWSSDDARAIIAHVRTLPALVAPSQQVAVRETPDAAARRVMALLDEALAAANAARPADAGDKAFDAYIAFEPLETAARAADPGAVTAMEAHFADFKGAVKAGDLSAARTARDAVAAGMPRMLELSAPATGWWTPFLQAFLIIVREGFEAILVIGAVIAFLMKTGHREQVRRVWHGVIWALIASAGTAVALMTVFRSLPASRELVEGGTMLLAVAVLFSVSYWLISKADAAKWNQFIRGKVTAALQHGGGTALVVVGFLAVYREGAETALFFQALFSAPDVSPAPIAAGIAVGFVALVGIYLGFHRFGMKLPMKPFFQVTSGLLYLMAFVFAGKGVRELQEGDALPITALRGWPQVESLGVFPTLETMLAQGVLVLALAYAIWRTVASRRAVAAEAAREEAATRDGTDHVHSELEGRLAELTAKATVLQERVRVLEEELTRARNAPNGS
jgi:high-affinity iron transporter